MKSTRGGRRNNLVSRPFRGLGTVDSQTRENFKKNMINSQREFDKNLSKSIHTQNSSVPSHTMNSLESTIDKLQYSLMTKLEDVNNTLDSRIAIISSLHDETNRNLILILEMLGKLNNRLENVENAFITLTDDERNNSLDLEDDENQEIHTSDVLESNPIDIIDSKIQKQFKLEPK